MPVTRIHAGLWQAAKEDCTATVGNVTFQVSIDPAYVRGIAGRAVDPCICAGLSEDGHALHLQLPREPVIFGVAQEMVSPGWFTTPDGVSRACSVTWPACRSRRAGPGLRMADAVTARGMVER